MTQTKKSTRRHSATGKFVIGLEASVRISRVEGLKLSKDMRETFGDFAKKEMPPTARREALARKYGKRDS